MNTIEKIKAHRPDIYAARNIARAINHPLRLRLLEVIYQHGARRQTVTELYTTLRIEQSICSNQLAILRHAGIVCATRDGKNIYYSIDESAISRFLMIFSLLNKS